MKSRFWKFFSDGMESIVAIFLKWNVPPTEHERVFSPVSGIRSLVSRLQFALGGAKNLRASADFIGEAEQIKKIRQRSIDLAPTKIPVLITGETGTGKEVVAKYLHDLSQREGSFVVVDCGALTPTLMEEELFGHERGAYTGAAGPRVGLLQEADKGTVFLDEVGELPVELQTRLLRAFDRGTVRRIGSNRHTPIDVRFISATNRDLLADVVQGKFRRDLFFRLAGFTLPLPPLRERVEDIALLLNYFSKNGHSQRFSDEALECLRAYPWPGNVRELQLFAERVRALVARPVVNESEVRELLVANTSNEHQKSLSWHASSIRLCDVRDAAIKKALVTAHGNVVDAAKLLGIGKSTIYAWLGKRAGKS